MRIYNGKIGKNVVVSCVDGGIEVNVIKIRNLVVVWK